MENYKSGNNTPRKVPKRLPPPNFKLKLAKIKKPKMTFGDKFM
jgi:hypothetical protein